MLFWPRQADVVHTGDRPTALAISCQLTFFDAFAARIAFIISSRVMASTIHIRFLHIVHHSCGGVRRLEARQRVMKNVWTKTSFSGVCRNERSDLLSNEPQPEPAE